MHIPDGYISPIITIGSGMLTVPVWAMATQRVKEILDNRTIPLLAIFAALSFTIMMFNIPVPGGTTAHAIGGTLAAIVLGPWAAVIVVSVALIIQALFFGDGGVLAILANCLAMAVILPFVGYATYRVLASRAPLLSTRRAWAAGIGAYLGITASALFVGVLLGIQPGLFNDNGTPLYSPYPIEAAVPAMLIAHLFGASVVEGLVTGLGVAYLQKRHPELLTSLKGTFAGTEAVAEGEASRRPLWQIIGGTVMVALAILTAIGLVLGGGDPTHFFGADWSAVAWPDVATMLLYVAILAVIFMPLAYLILPRRWKRVGASFTALAILAPLGLIAPGLAYGEGSTADVQAAFGYVPSGLRDLAGVFSAPLSGYDLPFLQGDSLVRTAIGYEIAGMIGILLCGIVAITIGKLLSRRQSATKAVETPATATNQHPSTASNPASMVRDGRIGWLESTLGGISAAIERAVFTENNAREDGWLQRLDPRAKLGAFFIVLLAAGFTSSLVVLAILYAAVLLAAAASKVPFDFFVKRVWLGVPLFAGIVVIPALFLVPGPRLFVTPIGPFDLALSAPGVAGAILFVARVGVSVSLAVLLVVTTPWADLLKSLRSIRVPQVFVLVLSMTYRYIFLFLHTTNGLFLARKSRVVARTSGAEQRRWIAGSMGSLTSRSFKMSNDVYAAMMARGFTGEMRTWTDFRIQTRDLVAVGAALALVVGTFALQRVLP